MLSPYYITSILIYSFDSSFNIGSSSVPVDVSSLISGGVSTPSVPPPSPFPSSGLPLDEPPLSGSLSPPEGLSVGGACGLVTSVLPPSVLFSSVVGGDGGSSSPSFVVS